MFHDSFYYLGDKSTINILELGVFLVIFYFFISDVRHRKRIIKIVSYIIILLIVVTMINYLRPNSISFNYPLWRDLSLGDGYFAFYKNFPHNFGNNMIRLMQTGIPFLSDFNQYYDITYQLADERFGFGWGSLHPTAYAWLYLDLDWYGILASVYFSLFLSIVEYLRLSFTKFKLRTMLLPIELIFCAIFIRGSVQYAYSVVIYPIIMIFLLSVIYNIFLGRISSHNEKNINYTER